MLKIKSFFLTPLNRKRAFLLLTSIYIIGCLALFRSNFRYADDQSRIAFGYIGWRTDGRYVSAILAPIVNMSSYLTDISPVSQILALVFCAAGAILSSCAILKTHTLSLLDVISLIPVGLSPYFLGCLSYKFDSPYMGISVLFSCLAILYLERSPKVQLPVTVLCLLISACTYQASLGIYPILVSALLLHAYCSRRNSRELLHLFAKAVISFAAALILYVAALIVLGNNPFTQTEGLSQGSPFSRSLSNYQAYWKLIRSDIPGTWLFLACLNILIFYIIYVMALKGKRFLRFLLPLAYLVLTFVFAFGLYPFLASENIYSPRSMYGLGIFLSMINLGITHHPEIHTDLKMPLRAVGCLATVLLSWSCVVFAASYGNALYEENYYMNTRLNALLDDLKDCKQLNSGKTITVQVTGSIGFAPVLRNGSDQISRREGQAYSGLLRTSRADANLIQRLMIMEYLSSSDSIFTDFILYYYCDLPIQRNSDVDLTEKNLPVLIDNVYETIRGDDSNLLIELKSYDLDLRMD